MSANDDQAWEAKLDRTLKSLPELTAPAGLLGRTMSALEGRKKPAWHQQPWILWPVWLRVVSLFIMAALFSAAALVNWELAHSKLGTQFTHTLADRFSKCQVILSVLDTLGRAAVIVAQNLNNRIIALGAVMALSAYLICIALGTLTARLTSSRH